MYLAYNHVVEYEVMSLKCFFSDFLTKLVQATNKYLDNTQAVNSICSKKDNRLMYATEILSILRNE